MGDTCLCPTAVHVSSRPAVLSAGPEPVEGVMLESGGIDVRNVLRQLKCNRFLHVRMLRLARRVEHR
jgi:hypothetical protein